MAGDLMQRTLATAEAMRHAPVRKKSATVNERPLQVSQRLYVWECGGWVFDLHLAYYGGAPDPLLLAARRRYQALGICTLVVTQHRQVSA